MMWTGIGEGLQCIITTTAAEPSMVSPSSRGGHSNPFISSLPTLRGFAMVASPPHDGIKMPERDLHPRLSGFRRAATGDAKRLSVGRAVMATWKA